MRLVRSSDQDDSSDEDDSKELALMMRKFTRLSDKIGKKGYSFDPKKRMFRPQDEKKKICYNCGERGHISPNCPKPDKRRSSSKNKHRQESSDEDESDDDDDKKKGKYKGYDKKKSYIKKTKLFPRRE